MAGLSSELRSNAHAHEQPPASQYGVTVGLNAVRGGEFRHKRKKKFCPKHKKWADCWKSAGSALFVSRHYDFNG